MERTCMTLTMTYSTTQEIKDKLDFIMKKRFISASCLIRELITKEEARLRQEEWQTPTVKKQEQEKDENTDCIPQWQHQKLS